MNTINQMRHTEFCIFKENKVNNVCIKRFCGGARRGLGRQKVGRQKQEFNPPAINRLISGTHNYLGREG